jgi:hypothetical protein
MSDFPPQLPAGSAFALSLILQRLEEDPEFLDFAPYPAEDLEVLAAFRPSSEDEEVVTGEGKWSRLERESNNLFKLLTDFSKTLNNKDSSETMAYFRTATSLMEKIISLQERTANLKQVSKFHDAVLLIMEDVMSPDQRTQVMDRLKSAMESDT